MFSATMSGQIQRVIFDNKKDGKDAMVKVVLAVSKQYSTDPKTSKIFPLITIWGHDAAYLRNYAGVGQMITILNAEAEYFKNDKKLDEDGNPIEQVTFKAGKVSFPKADIMKALVAAGVAEEAEGGEEEEEESPRRKKRGSRDKKAGSKSRSSRRSRDEEPDEEEDEDEEEEAPRRKKKSAPPAKKKKAPAKKKVEDDDDYDDDYEDDDDDYFDDED